jgi:hypothetical protein
MHMMECVVKQEVFMNGYGYSFEPMMRTPCSYCDIPHYRMPQMQAMPEQYMRPEYVMPESLETMFPRSYMIIYPHIKHHCHMLEMMHGGIHNITREHIEEVCENIYRACEKDLNEYMKDEDDHEHEHDYEHESEHSHDHGQYRYWRAGFAGDLIKILLLRELLGRRHYPYRQNNYYDGYPPYRYFDYDFDYDYTD